MLKMKLFQPSYIPTLLSSDVDMVYFLVIIMPQLANLIMILILASNLLALINFIKNYKLCFLNGRIDSLNEHFTYISDKGKSVVDYIITPTVLS